MKLNDTSIWIYVFFFLFEKFNLREGKNPQTFAIGIKELWDIDPEKAKAGLAWHSVGWPLASDTYGGSFLYHLKGNQVAVGYVVGFDYDDNIACTEGGHEVKNNLQLERTIRQGSIKKKANTKMV